MEKKYQITQLKTAEISALLDLQRANLKANLDAQTIDSQGFVSFVYDVETMERMMSAAPQVIAKTADGTIVAYALSATIDFCFTNDLLRPLAQICLDLPPLSKKKFYLCGQVCVRDGWRGIGLFDALYDGHRRFFSEAFDCIVTEIADDNRRSLAAHKRVGFEIIHSYTEGDKFWHIVAWGFGK